MTEIKVRVRYKNIYSVTGRLIMRHAGSPAREYIERFVTDAFEQAGAEPASIEVSVVASPYVANKSYYDVSVLIDARDLPAAVVANDRVYAVALYQELRTMLATDKIALHVIRKGEDGKTSVVMRSPNVLDPFSPTAQHLSGEVSILAWDVLR